MSDRKGVNDLDQPLSWLPETWAETLGTLGEPSYRGRQAFEWIWRHDARTYDDIAVWPKGLRARMAERYPFRRVDEERVRRGADGTTKLLLRLADGERVETVLLPHDYGTSVCVSSQVGCNMGCTFCASGILGRVRNLNAGEIMDQVAAAAAANRAPGGGPVRRVDLMGIGEPLDNYDHVLRFCRLVHAAPGFNLSYRHITLSTSGVAPAIYRLADEQLAITLAVSLHAPNDALRQRLMPINRAYPLAKLMPAARYYFETTGRRVSFEYAMLADVNDDPGTARELVDLLTATPMPCHVNLIPWNPVPEQAYEPSPMARVRSFRDLVQQHGISCTIRRELGQDIDAACGQLRHREEADRRPSRIRRNPPRFGAEGQSG